MLARFARVLLLVALLAGWQAALDHSIEHAAGAHEESTLCGALDALTACAVKSHIVYGAQAGVFEQLLVTFGGPRAADPLPFLSHAPPAA